MLVWKLLVARYVCVCVWLRFKSNLIASDKRVYLNPEFGEGAGVQHVIHVYPTGQPFCFGGYSNNHILYT